MKFKVDVKRQQCCASDTKLHQNVIILVRLKVCAYSHLESTFKMNSCAETFNGKGLF